jgi:colanic acid/amylovoran biosynthesis glycosyltransferase
MFPQAKYIANFHGYDFSSRIRYHGLNYYDQLWQKADLVTTQSFFSRDCLISIGCPPERVIKHPVGIDVDRFTYRPRRLGAPGDEIHLAIVSRLTEKKAHRLILDAFAKLAAHRPNVFFHIVGGGELEEELRNRIEREEILRRQVRMHGFMTQNEVIELLDRCHLFVHPSITTMRWAEQEDTTTVLMEAQAMGLPVIATYHAGIPEVVRSGRSGILVPERNEDELLAAMETLVDNPDRWEPMGREGRAFVEANFDISMLNARLEWVFEKLRTLPHGAPLGIRSTEDLRGIID